MKKKIGIVCFLGFYWMRKELILITYNSCNCTQFQSDSTFKNGKNMMYTEN